MKKKKLTYIIAIIAVVIFWIVAACTTTAESVQESFWALTPPIIAIALALVTKEVYSSLFIGVLTGALLYSGFSFEGTIVHTLSDGYIAVLSDSYNVGILIFLVLLGILVQLLNKTGGSAAFGNWAKKHIKSRAGAMFMTMILGIVIFVDDYFNCLTVGSVMKPVTDSHKVSRAKLAYLIDSTAAPICIIAPISSWAAAVASYLEDANGMEIFIQAIPFNFYAIFTIIMMILLIALKIDFGPMAKHEYNATYNDDLYTTEDRPYENAKEFENPKGIILDMILPIVVLVVCCLIGLIYTGGFFSGETFVNSFANCDASLGLVIGSSVAVLIAIIYYLIRRVLSFQEIMESFPEGFKQMVPAILVLTFAWTLKNMTSSLGGSAYVENLVQGSAASFMGFLPFIIFLIAVGLSFATGTSWGTFGMLIPIVYALFSSTDPQLMIVSISACMAGSVCGDHCSPISDTTIMSSAGAQCNHLNHVSTQIPYALSCAAVCAVTYIIAGFTKSAWISLPIGFVILLAFLLVMKKRKPAAEK